MRRKHLIIGAILLLALSLTACTNNAIIKVLEDKQNIISIDLIKAPSFIYDSTKAQLMQYNSLGVSGGGL